MATKQFTALKDFRYGTRMLRAGDPVEMDGPNARLFTALGAVGQRKAEKPHAVSAMTTETVAKPKATRKRTAKKAK